MAFKKMCVVFVEPEGEENIGLLARVMANFGLENLVLVKPKCAMTVLSRSRAMHGYKILKKARVSSSFDTAISGFAMVVGTTSKVTSSTTRTALTPRDMSLPENSCIVFGRESRGLTAEELRKCDVVVSIPSSPKYSTLNITHAAAIIFYELFSSPPVKAQDAKQKKAMVSLFEKLAGKLGLRNAENSVKSFRSLVGRALVTETEAKGVSAVFSKALERFK